MGVTDLIASFINELLDEENGSAELQRVELAHKFNCVPSQINYVISTRFSPELGYVVESRRGGGGYIRIHRVQADPKQIIMHTVNTIGDAIDERTALALISNAVSWSAISQQAAKLMNAAVSNNSLKLVPQQNRDAVRANILKQMLINVF